MKPGPKLQGFEAYQIINDKKAPAWLMANPVRPAF